MSDKDFVLKCDRLPVLVTIEGEGCIEIGTEGMGVPNRMCGPASIPLTNIKVGIVKVFAMPGEGYELTNAMGIPKGKNTSINKPYFRFYYDGKFLTAGKDDQMLKLTFKFKPIAGYSMPPAGNMLGL